MAACIGLRLLKKRTIPVRKSVRNQWAPVFQRFREYDRVFGHRRVGLGIACDDITLADEPANDS